MPKGKRETKKPTKKQIEEQLEKAMKDKQAQPQQSPVLRNITIGQRENGKFVISAAGQWASDFEVKGFIDELSLIGVQLWPQLKAQLTQQAQESKPEPAPKDGEGETTNKTPKEKIEDDMQEGT